MTERRNINRGYMKLTVWQDAKAYYVLTCQTFRALPYELKRLIESLQEKQHTGEWQDSFVIRESNAVYGSEDRE